MMTQQMEQTLRTPAHAYQEYFGPAIFEPLARIVLEYEPPRAGDRVLDVACGTGIVTRHASRLTGVGGRVVGQDVNPGMLAVARSVPAPEGAAIEWMQGDAASLDLPDGAFDVVLCQQGLQFFGDRLAGAREMRRVLADGGRAIIACWHAPSAHPLLEAMADAEEPHLAAAGVQIAREDLLAPFSLGDADELRGIVEAAGFRDVVIESRSIEARFADADRFVERMEFAYSAVVPAFAADPAAFQAFIDAVRVETRSMVDPYRVGDEIVLPMHTHIAVAQA